MPTYQEEEYRTGKYLFEVEVAGRVYTSSLMVESMKTTMTPPIVEVREATTDAFSLSWGAVAGAALYRVSADCKNSAGELTGEVKIYPMDTSVAFDADSLGLETGVTCFYEVMAFNDDFRQKLTSGGTNVSVEAAVYRNAFEGVPITNP